jgi:S1-C subfamily serine protease
MNTLIKKVFVAMVIGLFIGNVIGLNILIRDIQYEIQINKKSSERTSNSILNSIDDMTTIEGKIMLVLDILSHTQKNLIDYINDKLDTRISEVSDKEIQRDKVNQFLLEKKLQQVNIFIKNIQRINPDTGKDEGYLGSGVTLKYKGKFYILTAAHLLVNDTDVLTLSENDQNICKLKVIKIDKQVDLLLLQPIDENITVVGGAYTELAHREPLTAQKVYVVGNPIGIEDALCEGRVLDYKGKYMVIKAIDTFFGNSGGGIYNQDGELVGIVSAAMAVEAPNFSFPSFVLDLEIRLNAIKIFLENVE